MHVLLRIKKKGIKVEAFYLRILQIRFPNFPKENPS
ncbi:hypothetical protein G5S_0915 [Chlamydia pecorum E58]|uniref:Uncharacterized protein n=1 Tax=Chlamydia pecorum (strain ATCC VR-628 / DSM 29919 / E58) TaxID=331635 RepID=A0AA34RDR6_CHLPE|nr:hypothetical protein G5S_0915 [Chlamydia pecorum E58]